jgi:Ca2+-binding EF-hand superfamily protein
MINARIVSSLLIIGTLAAVEVPPSPGTGGASTRPQQGPPLEEILKSADADGDGKISKGELAVALEQLRAGEKRRVFAAIDANGDGTISKDEFMSFEPPAPPGADGKEARRRGPDVEELFKRLDRNGDGFIAKEELPRRPGRDFFEEADANGDGQLSKEEIQAARERMQEERGERREKGPAEKNP